MSGTLEDAGARFTADAFEQEREALWDWCRALGGMTRQEFDARFDEELAEMRAEEEARQQEGGA